MRVRAGVLALVAGLFLTTVARADLSTLHAENFLDPNHGEVMILIAADLAAAGGPVAAESTAGGASAHLTAEAAPALPSDPELSAGSAPVLQAEAAPSAEVAEEATGSIGHGLPTPAPDARGDESDIVLALGAETARVAAPSPTLDAIDEPSARAALPWTLEHP